MSAWAEFEVGAGWGYYLAEDKCCRYALGSAKSCLSMLTRSFLIINHRAGQIHTSIYMAGLEQMSQDITQK